MLYPQIVEQGGERTRNDQPVFQRIARAGRILRTVCHHPPAPVRRSGQIGGVEMQMDAIRHHRAMHGAQEAALTEDQLRRDEPLLQQGLRAVEIGQDLVEQARTLNQSGLHLGPLFRRDEQRQPVQLPGPLWPAGIAVDVVGDAAVLNLPLCLCLATAHAVGAGPGQLFEQGRPVGAWTAGRDEHFIVALGGKGVSGQHRLHLVSQNGSRTFNTAHRCNEGKTPLCLPPFFPRPGVPAAARPLRVAHHGRALPPRLHPRRMSRVKG